MQAEQGSGKNECSGLSVADFKRFRKCFAVEMSIAAEDFRDDPKNKHFKHFKCGN